MGFHEERRVAVAAVTEAARLCRLVRAERVVGKIEKADRSPVTVADFGAQALVCGALRSAFPLDPIVAEEDTSALDGSDALLAEVSDYVRRFEPAATPAEVRAWIAAGSGAVARRYWTLDPIDGTKGFLRNDQYAVALALVEDGQVAVAALACPALPLRLDDPASSIGVVFLATRGGGAWMVPLDAIARHGNAGIRAAGGTAEIGETGRSRASSTAEGTGGAGENSVASGFASSVGAEDPWLREAVRVRVAAEDGSGPDRIRFAESVEPGHGDHALQAAVARAVGITAPPLRMDSQAKYGALARGDAALYLRLPSPAKPDYRERIWDHAAGSLLVQEAGGRVTDMHGRPLDFASGRLMLANRGVVAGTAALHAAALEAIAAHG